MHSFKISNVKTIHFGLPTQIIKIWLRIIEYNWSKIGEFWDIGTRVFIIRILTLLINWATPITFLCPLTMGMQRMLLIGSLPAWTTSFFSHVVTSPMFKIWPVAATYLAIWLNGFDKSLALGLYTLAFCVSLSISKIVVNLFPSFVAWEIFVGGFRCKMN